MALCATCSTYSVCTSCDTSAFLRNDLTGCVLGCNEDTSAALTGVTYKIPSYHATLAKKKCVSNCSAFDPTTVFATTLDSCILVSACTGSKFVS